MAAIAAVALRFVLAPILKVWTLNSFRKFYDELETYQQQCTQVGIAPSAMSNCFSTSISNMIVRNFPHDFANLAALYDEDDDEALMRIILVPWYATTNEMAIRMLRTPKMISHNEFSKDKYDRDFQFMTRLVLNGHRETVNIQPRFLALLYIEGLFETMRDGVKGTQPQDLDAAMQSADIELQNGREALENEEHARRIREAENRRRHNTNRAQASRRSELRGHNVFNCPLANTPNAGGRTNETFNEFFITFPSVLLTVGSSQRDSTF